jgi:branched-chain amino acid transport system substrate-binding protein
MISPSTSSTALSGIDDYFLRVIPDNKAIAQRHAMYTYDQLQAKNVVCVVDLSNEYFSMTYFNNFRTAFEHSDGATVHAVKYISGLGLDYRGLVDDILSPDPDSILIITNPMDAAMICQYLAKRRYNKSITSQGWALAEEFITNSGKSSEGVIFPIYTDPNSKNEAYLAFKEKYKQFFKGEPQWIEIFTYEAVMVLRDALMKAKVFTPGEIKKKILEQKKFHGLQKDFSMDRYGDGKRDIFFLKVKNSKFVKINQ